MVRLKPPFFEFHKYVRKGQSSDGWPKMYYLKILRHAKNTLSRCSRLHLKSLASTPFPRTVDVRQAAGRKNKPILYHNMMKNMVPTPPNVIRVIDENKKNIRLFVR
jgi:hypothetical protein